MNMQSDMAISTDFRKSNEAAERRLLRAALRKAPLTPLKRDIAEYLLNLWFCHKSRGVMAPGVKQIARKIGCSPWTVSHTLGELRACGALVSLKCANGGRGGATQYRLDHVALLVFCGYEAPVVVSGKLVEIHHTNAPPLPPPDVYERWDEPGPSADFTHETDPGFTHESHVNFTHETSVNFTHEPASRVNSPRVRDAHAHLQNQRIVGTLPEQETVNAAERPAEPEVADCPFQRVEPDRDAVPPKPVLPLVGVGPAACGSATAGVGKRARQRAREMAGAVVRQSSVMGTAVQPWQDRYRRAVTAAFEDYAAMDNPDDPRAWA